MPTRSFLPMPDRLSGVERRALIRFLEQGLDHGFRLAIVEAAGHVEREVILSGVAATIGPGLLRVAIDELSGARINLWKALQAPFSAAHNPRCLALWGLGSGSDWASQLNVQRDLFVRDFAVPWLLFIHPAARVPLLQAAPDFCDYAILWLRDERKPLAPAMSTSLHTQHPLLHQAQAALEAGQFAAARDALARFDLQRERDGFDSVHRQLLGARLERGQGHLARAKAFVSAAQEALERLPTTEQAQSLACLIDRELGAVLMGSGRYDAAKNAQCRALLRFETALGPDHPDTLRALQSLAVTLHAQGDLAGARNREERVLARFEAVQGPNHPDTLRVLQNLALTLKAQGDLVGARNREERVLAGFEATLGPDHPNTCGVLQNLAVTLYRQGDLVEARKHYEKAISIYERILGPDHPDTFRVLQNLAVTLHAQGDLVEARKHYERAFVGFEAALGPDHPDTLRVLQNLAALTALGDVDRAISIYNRALAGFERILGLDHPDTLRVLQNLALALKAQGYIASAGERLERALAGYEAALGPDHPDTRNARFNLAIMLINIDHIAAVDHVRILDRMTECDPRSLSAIERDIVEKLPLLHAKLRDLRGWSEREIVESLPQLRAKLS